VIELSIAQARRVALGAQGFSASDKRPTGRVDRRHLRRVLDRVGLIQIDSVNVLVRSQELPVFARLGPHPRDLIPKATAAGELFEYWVHEASHVPVEQHPLYRWAMSDARKWKAFDRMRCEHPEYLAEVIRRVSAEGPLVAGDLKQRSGPKGAWWDWDLGKIALETLFASGELTATRRPSDFARVYDLPERVIPSEVLDLPTPSADEAKKELLVLAARYHGVGTAADLADYHRLRHTRPLFAELVEEGRLLLATVEGWTQPAYLHPDVVLPRRIDARALLSPFDPIVWFRDRALRLFDFHYRIEIYVPKPKRQYGYFVLPFLLGDRLVARVDLKADRQRGKLLIQSAFGEACIAEADVAGELLAELRLMAQWLGLEDGVQVGDRGDLSPALARLC